MKKTLFLLIIVTGFFACEGPEGPEGPIGPAGPKGEQGEAGYGTNWFVNSYTVTAGEWKLHGNPGDLNSYFYADKQIKELTDFVYNEGTIVAYMQTEKGVKNGMPYVLHRGGTDSYGEFLWTQTYDFDFYTGGVRFYLTYSDFNTQIAPETETFHVVLMW
jgi:hypothetical protein